MSSWAETHYFAQVVAKIVLSLCQHLSARADKSKDPWNDEDSKDGDGTIFNDKDSEDRDPTIVGSICARSHGGYNRLSLE